MIKNFNDKEKLTIVLKILQDSMNKNTKKEKLRIYHKEYYKKNKCKLKNYQKEKYNKDNFIENVKINIELGKFEIEL
jgi:hypothetical protein